jgi:anti-anti-sigma factor
MQDPILRVDVRSDAGSGVTVALAGELDIATAPQFRLRADEIVRDDGDVHVDCSELTFADSSGLDVLLRLSKALQEQQRRLVLANVRPIVRQAMDLLRLTDVVELE